MAQVEVRDRVMWTKHIHGEPRLARKLQNMPAGRTVRLRVNGLVGVWEKMRNRPSGDPTPGLRPIGEAASRWRKLFDRKRGQLVELTIDTDRQAETISRTPEEREAAWRAIVEATRAGWRSSQPYGSRDEFHER
jgi:hypothetical protein